MSLTSKPCCRNCHFFIKNVQIRGDRFPSALEREERATLNISPKQYFLECAQGVWGRHTDKDTVELVDEPRGDSCFFWPIQDGMSIEAAKVLQERAAETRALKKSQLLTQIGLFIAAAALVASVLQNCSGSWTSSRDDAQTTQVG